MTDFGRKHASTHEDGGADEIDTTDLDGHVAGGSYIDRGDPSSPDFIRPNLDTDGSEHDMDLSSIVPEGAIAVHLKFRIMGTSVGLFFMFKEKGNSNFDNSLMQYTQIANSYIAQDGRVMLDSNRVITYKTSNDAFGWYGVTVRGWYL
jgi:hypothetical protein